MSKQRARDGKAQRRNTRQKAAETVAAKKKGKQQQDTAVADALSGWNIHARCREFARKAFNRNITDEQEARNRAKGRTDPAPKSAQRPLAMRTVIGNAVLTGSETIIWFTVPARSDSFSPVEYIEQSIRDDARVLSKLVGFRCHVRSSNRPHPVGAWAERTWQDAHKKGRPLPGFRAHLMRQQSHMADQAFNEKWVYFGVRVGGYRRHPLNPEKELESLRHKIDEVTNVLAVSSLKAVPASRRSMEWLLRRSVGLGLPCPEVGVAADYQPSDIEALEAHARWTAEPFTGHIEVTGNMHGVEGTTTRKVAVLTLGRLSDHSIPQETATGWMQRTDGLDFEVEWAATFDVIEDEAAMAWILRRLQVIDGQEGHYNEHGVDVPPSLDRQRRLARQAQADLDSDHGGLATRTVGWYRIAISADDTETLDKRVAAVRKAYGSKAELVLMPNQYDCAREFIPGEPLSTTAHERRMSTLTLAAAVPHGSSEIGDRFGMPVGRTAGSAVNATAWATHQNMEEFGKSGLCIICGEQGAGKSFILGSIVAFEALSGAECFVLDPSARLGQLTRLPELKPYSKEINLFRGQDGALNPYEVVPDPVREHFAYDENGDPNPNAEDDYQWALANARGTRRALASDVLNQSLKSAYQQDRAAMAVMDFAIDAVPYEAGSCPMDVIEILERIAKGELKEGYQGEVFPAEYRTAAGSCARNLRAEAQTPIGRLLFPRSAQEAGAGDEESGKDIRLTVYTLNGLNIPDENDRNNGTAGTLEKQALMVVRLAAFLVQSRIYQGDPHSRKCLALDEGKIIVSFPEGKKLVVKSSTDSRKHNLRFLLCSQDVTHFDFGESENSLGNQVGAAFIGHTVSEGAVRAALKVLRAPEGEGYEEILKTLRPKVDKHAHAEAADDHLAGTATSPRKEAERPRQVVFFDGSSTERILFDQTAHPDICAALDTNARGTGDKPGRRRAQTEDEVAA